ncbi:MAG TPA: hypothetical protein VIA62_05015 [Thermoanaerobaculia bacterium]|jgi:hypothetical protein|nr:hypothetical protein [Thermoanaerobaculia bacterium]
MSEMPEMTERPEMSEPIPLRPSGPHPTPAEIYSARIDPDGPGAERVLRHAAGCARCSEEMARQEAFDQPEPLPAAALDRAWERFGRGEPDVRRERRERRPAWQQPAFALAAALTLCLLGLGIWVAERPRQEADVERGSAEATTGMAPSGVLAAAPVEFTFPAPGDQPRRVKVFDSAQTYVWTSAPTFGSRIVLPETERRRLKPGVEYFWTVVGGAGEGGTAQSFEIRK